MTHLARYRVVYGETCPMWDQTFPTMREARAFAKTHKSFGDVIFSITKVVPGEPPKSIVGAIKVGMRAIGEPIPPKAGKEIWRAIRSALAKADPTP